MNGANIFYNYLANGYGYPIGGSEGQNVIVTNYPIVSV